MANLRWCIDRKLEFAQHFHELWIHKLASINYVLAFSEHGENNFRHLFSSITNEVLMIRKTIKMEYALKSRFLLHFRSNFDATLNMQIQICSKNKISKNFNVWLATKNTDLPLFPDFGSEFPEQDFIMIFQIICFLITLS